MSSSFFFFLSEVLSGQLASFATDQISSGFFSPYIFWPVKIINDVCILRQTVEKLAVFYYGVAYLLPPNKV